MLKMVLCFTSILIASFWVTLCETEGSFITERILPNTNNSYVFDGDVIKVACQYTTTQEIKQIKWSYYVQYPQEDTEQLNDTNTIIRNEWHSNRTAVRSILEVFDVPKKHPKFYYKFQADGRDILVLYDYIQAKAIPKARISDTIIGKKNATANETVEGIYNSSIEFKCTLDFERNQLLDNEYVDLMLCKNSKILAEESRVEYGKAESTLVSYNLDGLEVDSGGVYSCISQMVIGKRHFTSQQYVNLTLPLRLTGDSKKEMTLFSGQDVELVCEIEGFPTPKWTFQYPGIKNARNITVVQNRLQILDVQTEHEGLYVCIASNENGYNKTQNFFLHIIANGNNKGFKHSQQVMVAMYLLLIAVACLVRV